MQTIKFSEKSDAVIYDCSEYRVYTQANGKSRTVMKAPIFINGVLYVDKKGSKRYDRKGTPIPFE